MERDGADFRELGLVGLRLGLGLGWIGFKVGIRVGIKVVFRVRAVFFPCW